MSEMDEMKIDLAERLAHWPCASYVGGTLFWPPDGRTFWVEVPVHYKKPPVLVFDGRRIETDAAKLKTLCDLLEIPLGG